MAMAERRARAVWEGNLTEGKGRFQVGSGAIPELPVTWAARTEEPQGMTSPEELIAAAHATCFSMALSNELANVGHAPERLEVATICTLDRVNGKPTITTMDIEVTGSVPGISVNAFQQAAEAAGQGCPVSRALGKSVQIRVQARLAQG